MLPITDLHMHVVFAVDDGARNIGESLQMLKMAESQGITDVFCTSHNGYSVEDGEKYLANFKWLKEAAEMEGINVRLHKGCEILCAGEYMEDILYGLKIGAFTTLGDSKYVLAEMYSDVRPTEALQIISELKKHGYIPIIAHMERNRNITGMMVNMLIQSGALIQVNISSFTDADGERQTRARELLEGKRIHFIGTDAHRTDNRPPDIRSGVEYITANTDGNYAKAILSGNASAIINEKEKHYV